jgi:hypothetical protein
MNNLFTIFYFINEMTVKLSRKERKKSKKL